MIHVAFDCESEQDLIKWARDLLQEFGFEVSQPDPLHAQETPSEFSRRMGTRLNSFARTLRNPGCPTNYMIRKGGKGVQTIWIRASKELEEFFRANKRRGGKPS